MIARGHLWQHGLVAIALVGVLTVSREAAAEPPSGGDVVVLRRGGGADEAPAGVADAVVGALRERATFAAVQASPTSMEQLALAAGCDEGSAGCGTRIAQTVSATIVVWDVASVDQGRRLTLTAFEPRGHRATVAVAGDDREAVQRGVKRLTRRLGRAATRGAGASGSSRWARDDRHTRPVASTVGLAALGGGTVVLAGGISLAVSGANARDRGSEERTTRRARGSYALLSLGSALLAVGGTLLAVQLSSGDDDAWAGAVSVGDGTAMAWLKMPVGR